MSEAEVMVGKFVMVGSQDNSSEAQIGEDWDPLHVAGISSTQWEILKMVGRARY